MSVSWWNDHSKESKTTFDIIIIGGGIAGLSTAYWLEQEDSSLKLAIIDKYEIGSGATGRNAGFVTCGSVEHYNRLVEHFGLEQALQIWSFGETNLKLLETEIIGKEHLDLEYNQTGSFSLASTDSEFKELINSQEIMYKNGIQTEVLQEKEIKERIGAKGFVGGIKYLDDASINPIKLLHKIKEKLKNTIIFENNELIEIKNAGDQRLLKTNKQILNATSIIYATNAYSAQLDSYFSDKITPTRGQIMLTAPVPMFMEGPCYANFVLDYFRQLTNGVRIKQ